MGGGGSGVEVFDPDLPAPEIPEEFQEQMETFGYWLAVVLLGPAAYINLMLGFWGA